jgi:hypothetical protein
MVLSFIKYFFIGVMYYVFNFLYSLLDLWIIFFYCFFRFEGKILNKIKVFVGYVLLKFLVFYFYFFLPPRFVSLLEIKKYKINTYDEGLSEQGIYEGIGSYVYGETPYLTLFYILNDLKKVLFSLNQEIDFKRSLFIDLGCGVGKPVFTCNLLFNSFSLGIDNISTFINKANIIKKFLSPFVNFNKICFIKEDIINFLENFEVYLKNCFEKNIKEINYLIIYLPATAFSKILLNNINLKILKIFSLYKDKKIYIIVLSKKLNIKALNLIYKKDYYFSWFKSSVYFYEVI